MAYRPLITLAAALPAALLTFTAMPQTAEACGGFFCDAPGGGGPVTMPVDQSGENILFYAQDGIVEAHIQIEYEGDPEEFAWIVPVMAPPEVEAGSQALFDALLRDTVPTFTLDSEFETCSGDDNSIGCAFAASDDGALGAEGDSFGSGTNGTGDGDGDGDGPDIIDRGVAGAFEWVALTGDSVDEVVEWLDLAGYAQDDEAPPILQEYLDEDFIFVALKLRGGTGIEEVHPVVIRYEGTEPCVPIRLTRIAAVPDMGIRAFFLSDARWVPSNYQHLELNPLRFDWLHPNGPAANYLGAVIEAIDEAGGHAWVTEYAGTSQSVSQSGIRDPRWDPEPFETAEEVGVVDILESQGLFQCGYFDEFGEIYSCNFVHPLVGPIVEDYLPVPEGVDQADFYECVSCYADLIDPDLWDGEAFAADFQERVVAPGDLALTRLQGSSYLSRLFTTLSPSEMTVDPLFWKNEDMGDVSNSYFATRHFACEGPDWIELEDGTEVALDGSQMPNFDDMSWSVRVEDVPANGPAMTVENNEESIDDVLREWNDSQRQGPDPSCSVDRRSASPERIAFGALLLLAVAGVRRRRS